VVPGEDEHAGRAHGVGQLPGLHHSILAQNQLDEWHSLLQKVGIALRTSLYRQSFVLFDRDRVESRAAKRGPWHRNVRLK
jgi:hypothetical protein